MNFLFTSYFYPLSGPMDLSKQLKFSFDNPRTEKEVEYARRYLTDWYESKNQRPLPVFSKEEDIVTLETILTSFRDTFSSQDNYIKEFFASYKRKSIFDLFAKMWVVARFDDEGEVARLGEERKRMREAGEQGFVILEDGHPIIRNSSKLVGYSHLLSLLSHTEGESYSGRNFVLDPDQLFRPKILEELTMHLVMFYAGVHDFKVRPNYLDELRWIFWPSAITELAKNAQLLESAFESGLGEKLLYIGRILKIVHEVHDDKVELLMLTSIIELLLTHNPDTSRFNVEDSITRQFQLKAAVLVYLNDRNRDLEHLKKRLRTIYQQRSNVAHGNFGEVESFIRKLSKKEGKEEYFDDLIVDLYVYIRAILEEYLKDNRFVEFLKES